MLQANQDITKLDFSVFNPGTEDGSREPGSLPQPVKAPCSTTAQLIDLFEEITGWQVAFDESDASLCRRKMSASENEPAQGDFSIIDMSADWPAKTPTCHRGKCDQLVVLINSIVSELQETRVELSKNRSALAALDSRSSVGDDEVLVDSFVPKYGRRWDDLVPLDGSARIPGQDSQDTDFELRQSVSDSLIFEPGAELVTPPFPGWSLGGKTGIDGHVYLDWTVDSQERIAISVGKIESDLGIGDAETTITVDPLTNEYQVSGDDTLSAFYIWDSRSKVVFRADRSKQWCRLKPFQSIVTTTALQLSAIDCVETIHEGNGQDDQRRLSAQQLASSVGQQFDPNERVLVLQRS